MALALASLMVCAYMSSVLSATPETPASVILICWDGVKQYHF
jgi:hypothetical protein